MRVKTIPLAGCLLLSLVVCQGFAANGGDSENDTADQCPFGIIEGPDPIGLIDCLGDPKEKSGNIASQGANVDSILPPGQVRSAQGRPDFGQDAISGLPFMVWADRNAGYSDIAFASWVDTGWGRVEYVASTQADERDPRAFAAADGSIYVAWWTDEAIPRVHYARRDPDFDGWTPSRPVADGAMRPTPALIDGRLWVAYERDSKTGQRLVVIAGETPDGTFAERIVATSERTQELDIELHVEAGRVWLDWKRSNQELGFAEWTDGSWSAVGSVPWTDHSWHGERQARQRVREELFQY